MINAADNTASSGALPDERVAHRAWHALQGQARQVRILFLEDAHVEPTPHRVGHDVATEEAVGPRDEQDHDLEKSRAKPLRRAGSRREVPQPRRGDRAADRWRR